jgi:hypothetical protein
VIDTQVRKHGTGVRLSAWERATLEAVSHKEGVSLSEMIRRLVIDAAKRSLLPPEGHDVQGNK